MWRNVEGKTVMDEMVRNSEQGGVQAGLVHVSEGLGGLGGADSPHNKLKLNSFTYRSLHSAKPVHPSRLRPDFISFFPAL